MKPNQKPALWTAAGLTALALFLRFALRGVVYLSYTLLFIAGMIVCCLFLPVVLRRILWVLVALGLIWFTFLEVQVIRDARTDPDPERPYLVVLGAAVYGTVPSRTLANRVYPAAEYLQKYPDSMVIVCGGQGPGEEITEAECMARVLEDVGIDPSRILQEGRSVSTDENIRFAADIIRSRGDDPDGNMAILSSSYHLCRAKRIALNAGIHACGVAGWPGNPFVMLSYFIREAFGLTHLLVFGN
ncbi:MAG: YdcF family protein [Oscillospiraceae bacterium]|nr:YdcF family protein [Oscillospiraceae bacterium]